MQFISNSNSSSETESKPSAADDVPSKLTEPIAPAATITADLSFALKKEKPQYVPPRDPRKPIDDAEPESKKQPFEFFTRHVPETSAPTPSALDENARTPHSTKATSDTSSDEDSVPMRKRSAKTPTSRTSIYEYESSDSNGETDPIGPNTKDKDMRLSSLFVDKANSKGKKRN